MEGYPETASWRQMAKPLPELTPADPASNIAHGRDTAGVHWRSDDEEGLRLGEKVAIRLLRSNKTLSNDTFVGFSITKFDGTTITV
jgi:hypothetical protein